MLHSTPEKYGKYGQYIIRNLRLYYFWSGIINFGLDLYRPRANRLACFISNVPMFFWKNAFPNAHQWAGTLRFFLENIYQEATTNQTRWHANEQKIVVWRCLGAVWGGLGAQRARKPTRMHFRMRKPRSWLTLGGCFLVQFWCFFVFFFVVFSSLRPERYFMDFYAILSLFSTPFLEFFAARWK